MTKLLIANVKGKSRLYFRQLTYDFTRNSKLWRPFLPNLEMHYLGNDNFEVSFQAEFVKHTKVFGLNIYYS